MKRLDLNDSPWTMAYDQVVNALRLDPTLSTIIHPAGWRTYTDEDANDVAPGADTLPAIEVLPFGMQAGALTITSQTAPLGISISVATEGNDVRDLMNLWWSVHCAIFTGDASRTLFSAIRDAFQAADPPSGSQLESIMLAAPALTPSGPALKKQIMAANGILTLNMRVKK